MTKPSTPVITLCGALVLTAALLLAPLSSARGRVARGTDGAANPAGREDPCKHPDKKPKKKEQCLPEQTSGGVARGDFNGDGFGDLAIGVPGEDVGSISDAGAVNVIYGTAAGLSAAKNQFWTQDSANVLNTAEEDDRFGSALASGDFDGDGFSDLAVGVPGEEVGVENQGAVAVLYGTANGLTPSRNQLWSQDSAGVLDDPEPSDLFGSTLVWGDFDGDGFGDLAVGVPGERVREQPGAGAVNVIYGTDVGLTPANNQFWTQDAVFGGFFSQSFETFGAALAAGDFNKDGSDDLAVGVTRQSVGSQAAAGEVDILYGSAGVGLAAAGSQSWTQNSDGVLDAAEPLDFFGSALAVGDFSGDGAADLAIGAPSEKVAGLTSAGTVTVLYGSAADGLTSANCQFLTQDSSGILDAAETGDSFGSALAAGDFNGDGLRDLAIGVPGETVGDLVAAGAVNVLYGGVRFRTVTGNIMGLVSANNQFWTQDSAGILDGAEAQDRFGSSLTAWNFGNGPQADLAIGSPDEDLADIHQAGAVNVLYGSSLRLTDAGDQFWHQDSEGIFDQAEKLDNFGEALY